METTDAINLELVKLAKQLGVVDRSKLFYVLNEEKISLFREALKNKSIEDILGKRCHVFCERIMREVMGYSMESYRDYVFNELSDLCGIGRYCFDDLQEKVAKEHRDLHDIVFSFLKRLATDDLFDDDTFYEGIEKNIVDILEEELSNNNIDISLSPTHFPEIFCKYDENDWLPLFDNPEKDCIQMQLELCSSINYMIEDELEQNHGHGKYFAQLYTGDVVRCCAITSFLSYYKLKERDVHNLHWHDERYFIVRKQPINIDELRSDFNYSYRCPNNVPLIAFISLRDQINDLIKKQLTPYQIFATLFKDFSNLYSVLSESADDAQRGEQYWIIKQIFKYILVLSQNDFETAFYSDNSLQNRILDCMNWDTEIPQTQRDVVFDALCKANVELPNTTEPLTGKSLYVYISGKLGSDEKASLFLANKAQITGIRYVDDERTKINHRVMYNYVIFEK